MLRFSSLLLAAACAIAGVASAGVLAAQTTEPVLIKGHPAHPTRVLARVAPASAKSAHVAALAHAGMSVVRTSALVPGQIVLEFDAAPAALMTTGATASAGALAPTAVDQLLARIEALRATGLYEYVEPDYMAFPDATPTDSAFTNGMLWGLHNTGYAGGVAGIDIDAVQAWDVTKGSTNVIVAVVDSGVRYTHTELAAQMWRNPRELANGLDDDGNGHIDDIYGINAINGLSNPLDDYGHGTHVAGIIGAAANDGHAIVGVAWQVRIMALKFLPSDGGGGATSDAITCIEYAVANGANIVNCSWGSPGESHALREVIVAAQARGVLVVAAAGNSSSDNDTLGHYPSGYDLDNVIAVAAFDRNGALASFSNYGATSVHLGAPGVEIYSSFSGTDVAYYTASGTSMAAPFVSGVAALVRARFPGISIPDLRDRLLKTTVAMSSLAGRTTTGGRVSAHQAVTAVGDGQLELAVSPSSGSVIYAGRTVPVVARATDLIGVTGATVTATPSGGTPQALRDDGVAPDRAAGDANYTGLIAVPTAPGTLLVDFNASAPGKVAAGTSVTYTVNLPPANDMFGDRVTITGNAATITTNNLGGTIEPGEPQHAGNSGGASIWWSWTPESDCSVTVSTEGSPFDTILGVYTGAALGALVEIASNDDINGPSQPSRVTFLATHGVPYQIAVDGFDGESGPVTLTLTARVPPPNDNFADRITLPGAGGVFAGTDVNGALEPGEPLHRGNSTMPRSTWWTWTAPETGTATITLETYPRYGVIAVYAGSTLSTLQRMPLRTYDPQSDYTSRAVFAAVAGTTYQIAAGCENWDSGGPFTLRLATALLIPGDHFASRIVLTGESAAFSGTNTFATIEIGEPLLVNRPTGASLWWTWTAPHDGTVVAALSGTVYEPLIGIFTGDALGALVPVPGSPGRGGYSRPAEVAFRVSAGTAYQIAMDGSSSGLGSVSGSIGFVDAPANDDFAGATRVFSADSSHAVSLRGATREPGEPAVRTEATGRTLWWRFVAPARGTLRVQSSATGIMLGLYAGSSLAGLQRITTTPQYANNVVVAHVEAGEEVRILADCYSGYAGDTTISIRLHEAPANDMFADRIAVAGDYLSLTADLTQATREAGEPSLGSSGNVQSVWWSWTPTTSGTATIRTSGIRGVGVSIVTGTSLSGLTVVRWAGDGPGNFPFVAGTTYQLAMASSIGTPGVGSFHLAVAGTPPNDAFAGRATLSGESASASIVTLAASTEYYEYNFPGHGQQSGSSVWWTWTAPRSGQVMVSTEESDYDTLLAVVTGTTPGLLTTVASNDDSPLGGTRSRLYFPAVAGTTYHIFVDGKLGAVGRLRLALRFNETPANDPFAAREILTGPAVRVDGSNVGATAEASEPGAPTLGPRASVWWSWTAPADTMAEFSTAGSSFDTVLSVFRGDALGQLVLLGSHNDVSTGDLTSRVVLAVTAGQVFQVAVDGFDGRMGTVALAVSTGSPPSRPEIAGGGSNIVAGAAVRLEAQGGAVAGSTYQWMLDGVDIQGANTAALNLACAQSFQSGAYTVRVRNVFGQVVSDGVVVSVSAAPASDARLMNLSTRALCQTGDNILIPGFVIHGAGTKAMLIRGIGPTLAGFGVGGTLADPQMTLTRNGTVHASNDDWGTNANAAEIITTSATVGAFGLASGSADAALLLDLPAGQYTVMTSGKNAGTGVAMVELYDADPGAPAARLVNISNRGFVGTGDSIMIPGFVVSNEGARTFLVRAVGPTLAGFGVGGTLADPQLTVFSGNASILANDNWDGIAGSSTTSSVASLVGAFPLTAGSKDAAFVVTLPPGIYTVQASGVGATTGVALVEVYLVP